MTDQLKRWFKVAAAAALSKLPPVRCVSAPITRPISFLVVAPVSATTSSIGVRCESSSFLKKHCRNGVSALIA